MADEHAIILRKEAIARSLKRYFTGKPCPKGHIAERFLSTGTCVICTQIKRDKWALDYPDKEREKLQRWRHANSDHVRKRDNKYREANAEKARARERRWREKHGDRARAIKLAIEHNRRAKKIQSGGTHSAEDLAAILIAQDFRCVYCPADLRKVKRNVDHIVPLSRGGSNDKSNLQFTCSLCNLKKRDKDPVAFAQELGLL